ncbi:RNA-directed RNA polymerase [Trichinella pseudospiralis]
MSNVDKWLVQVERPLQLSVSDELVKKRARLLALWFCYETTKPAVGGVWLIRMDAYSEKRFSILIGPLATAMNAKVRLAPAVLFACSTCVSLVRRSLPSPTQWDIVDLM